MRHRFFLFIHGNSSAILNVDAEKLGRELVEANQKEDTARRIWVLILEFCGKTWNPKTTFNAEKSILKVDVN